MEFFIEHFPFTFVIALLLFGYSLYLGVGGGEPLLTDVYCNVDVASRTVHYTALSNLAPCVSCSATLIIVIGCSTETHTEMICFCMHLVQTNYDLCIHGQSVRSAA